MASLREHGWQWQDRVLGMYLPVGYILLHGLGPCCLACLVGVSTIMSAVSNQVQHMTV